jgi:signal transduction histidine kinase
MADPAIDAPPYQLPVRRLFWLPLGLSAILLLTVLSGLVGVAWRSLERIQPVQAHLAHIGRIQDVGLSMEQTLLRGMRGTQISGADLQRLRRQIVNITQLEQQLHPETQRQLQQIFQALDQSDQDPMEVLIRTLAQLREVLQAERAQHDLLLSDVARDSATELKLAIILLVVLPLAGGVLLLLLRVRIKHPLQDLGDLLGRLAARDYRPVPNSSLEETAGLVQPVFRSYNELVSRLQELEEEHRAREHTLEQEVRQATEALLAQSRELARAERLAAVGAVSAGLAHELRNPLAGILMACAKLQRGLDDQGQATRVAAVLGELKRINGLLTEQVDAARHVPEPVTEVRLSDLVDELLTLIRYQTPPDIVLEARIPAELTCLLPGAGLRQALLNLILNAVQALDVSGRITIAAEHQDDQLELSVSDDGPGFPEELLRAGVVRPFATGRIGGTGLGLAMVRRFTRDHDGELELRNREPQGAHVTLRLPCVVADAHHGADEIHA